MHKTAQTHPEIDAMEELHDECLEKIRKAIQNFRGEYSKLEQLSAGSNESSEEGIKQIRRSKQMILDLVEQFFNSFEENYMALFN